MSPDYERKNNVYILAIGPESDGTYVAARKTEGWTRNDTRIERAIGKLWMQDRLKEGLTTQADISKSIAKKGLQAPTIKYELTRLPPGYSAFQRPQVQPNGTTRPQVGVFGHPNGHFTSINDFYVHFKHLTDCVKENDDRCMCTLCEGLKCMHYEHPIPGYTIPVGQQWRLVEVEVRIV